MKNMNLQDVKKVLIIVELEDGSAHQVLATSDEKKTALFAMVATGGKLVLDKELMPIVLKTKD